MRPHGLALLRILRAAIARPYALHGDEIKT